MEEMLFAGNSQTDWRLFIDAVVFIALTALFFKFTDCFKKRLENSNIARFLPLFNKTAKALIVFFMAATFLQSHGYSLQALIAGFGITGLAVGFAAKETIASAFGALALLADKSFQLGDYIIVGTVEGTVEDINMRSTKIRAQDGALIIIPNNLMANSIIRNVSGKN
jgi:MscS family membrane protein